MKPYDHTQHAPLWKIVVGSGVVILAAMPLVGRNPALPWVFAGAALVTILFGAACGYLRVRDDGTRLVARFGPVPLFGTHVDYAKITGVHRERSRFIDGWGLHWVPPKGWIINIWGYDCVAVEMGKRMVRIGTDDPEGLEAFLNHKLQERTGA